MEQTPPAIGRMADRQSSQTGRREILIRGEPQRQQSAGNRVANRLSTAPLNHETRKACLPAGLVSGSRIWSSLLLKTDLHVPLTGRLVSQYSVSALRVAIAGSSGDTSGYRIDRFSIFSESFPGLSTDYFFGFSS